VRRFWELVAATVATTAFVLGLGLGIPPPTVAASLYQQVLRVYEREGTVAPCQFTSVQLEAALHGVDTYGAEYFADFTQAIQAALSSRAAGDCSSSGRAGGVVAAGGGSSPPPGSSRAMPLGALTAATSSGVPAPLAVLAMLAVALALLGALAAVRRARG
jgi:hypothetical protein